MDPGRGQLLRIGDEWEIAFERQVPQSPPTVWAAIVEPGAMSGWFDETHMPDPLQVGASIRFVHTHANMESKGRITALDPPRLIEWDWISLFGPRARMGFEILPEGDGARVIFRQQVSDPPTTARTLAGWHKCLDRLQAALGEDLGEPLSWADLFEHYELRVAAAGISVPQVGAPESKTTS
jgi:uncharacterized protein YndB with AHSA1/START domain